MRMVNEIVQYRERCCSYAPIRIQRMGLRECLLWSLNSSPSGLTDPGKPDGAAEIEVLVVAGADVRSPHSPIFPRFAVLAGEGGAIRAAVAHFTVPFSPVSTFAADDAVPGATVLNNIIPAE